MAKGHERNSGVKRAFMKRRRSRVGGVLVLILFLIVFALVGTILYWKIPSSRDTMQWARSLKTSEIEDIHLIVTPSAEDERCRTFQEEEFADAVTLVNKSTGRYIAASEALAGMSRTLYITMKDGTRHTVEYNGYLVIDGDVYADTFWGYSEDGQSLGSGDSKVPEGFEY